MSRVRDFEDDAILSAGQNLDPARSRPPAASPEVDAAAEVDAAQDHGGEAGLSLLLEDLAARLDPSPPGDGETPAPPLDEARRTGLYPPLTHLAEAFGLSPFERDVVMLCAAVELDGQLATLVSGAQGADDLRPPTFSLALSVLDAPHWSALSPAGPLRHWSLVELGAGAALTQSPLRLDEWVLHHLVGLGTLDRRLAALLDPLSVQLEPVPSHRRLAEQIAGMWDVGASSEGPDGELPVVQLVGADPYDLGQVAAAACAFLDLELYRVRAETLPTAAAELDELLRLWQREGRLLRRALLLDCEEMDSQDTARQSSVRRLVEKVTTPLLVSSRSRQLLGARDSVSFDVERPLASEQAQLWAWVLGDSAERMEDEIARLVGQFDLSLRGIERALDGALGELSSRPEEEDGGQSPERALGGALWSSCRRQARPELDNLAQRIQGKSGWKDLVLPEAQKRVLRELMSHVRHRTQVWEGWQFAKNGTRGLGTAALFAGPSGTGKTLAGEVLANALELDIYRIDLSSVISKYIGETEKNLSRVFRAAEDGGVILLFDEADALFGKRTEVKDSHDRHANIEVSYLLQRMETYRGLAVLTTNLKNALDQAFLRRFRFIVEFPFPNAQQREEIWRRVFPAALPTNGLDLEKLSRLNVSGGNIRNIALTAAFLAADDGRAVDMGHVLHAARREMAKIGQPLPDADLAHWR